MHPRPQSRDERIAVLGILQRRVGAEAHRLAALRAGDDDFARLILPLRQVTAEQDLLRAGRDVGQRFRINARNLEALELDLHVAQGGLRDLAEQLPSGGWRALLAGDLAHRAAAQRRDRLQHGRLIAAAERDGVERWTDLQSVPQPPQPFRECDRIGVAGGDDAVADVNDVRFRAALLDGRRERAVEVGPPQRRSLRQILARGCDVPEISRCRLREGPVARHVAGREVKRVLRRQGREQRADEGRLLRTLPGIDRRGRVGDDQQLQRLAIGQQRPIPIPVRARRRELKHEVAVVAAAVRDHDDVGLAPLGLDDDLEIARRRVFLGRELDVSRVERPLVACRMRRRGHALERDDGVHLHVDAQLAQRVLLEQLALQGVAVAIPAPLERQHLRIGDLDALLRVGGDREDARLEDVAARPFEQPGVAPLAQDRLIDLTGPLLLDDVGLDQVVADPHAEAGDRRVLRQREIEDAFELGVGVVDERFLDDGAGDLIANIDGYLVIADGKRHITAIDECDERSERLVRRRSLEAEEPTRVLVHPRELLFVDADELPIPDRDFLLSGPEQLDRCAGGGCDLNLAIDQAHLLRSNQLDERLRSEDDAGLPGEAQRRRVGAARVGAQPVARPKHEVFAHRRPALVEHRLDGHDPLHVGHRADAAVLGERIGDDEFVRTDRLVVGDHGQLAVAALVEPRTHGMEPVGASDDEGFEPDLPIFRHSSTRYTRTSCRRRANPFDGKRLQDARAFGGHSQHVEEVVHGPARAGRHCGAARLVRFFIDVTAVRSVDDAVVARPLRSSQRDRFGWLVCHNSSCWSPRLKRMCSVPAFSALSSTWPSATPDAPGASQQ